MANKKVNTKAKGKSQEDEFEDDDFEEMEDDFEEEVEEEFDEDEDFDADEEGEEEIDEDEDIEDEDEEPAPKSKKASTKKAKVVEEDEDEDDDDIDDSDEDEDDDDIDDSDEDEDDDDIDDSDEDEDEEEEPAPKSKKASAKKAPAKKETKTASKKAPAKKSSVKKADKEEAPKKEKKGLPTAEEVYESLAEKNTINSAGKPITSSIISEKNLLGVLASFINDDETLEALSMEDPFTDKEVAVIKEAVFAAMIDICEHGGGFKLAEGVTIRGSYTQEKVWNNIPGKPASKIGSYLKVITNCPAPKSAKQIGEVSKGKFVKASASKKTPAKKSKK